MFCGSCHSGKVLEYSAEINIHFPGMKGLSRPSVWVFPNIHVCLDCGATRFTLPEAQRKELADGDHRDFLDEAVS